MRRHVLTGVVCVAAALTATACGTTLQNTGGAAGLQSSSTLGGGLGTGPTPGSGPSTGTGPTGTTSGLSGMTTGQTGSALGSTPGTTTGSTAGGASSAGGAAAGSSGGRGAGPGSSVVTARGVTAKTITVGVPLPTDGSALASSFGIAGAGSVPPQEIVDAVRDDVNKHGGILGRKLVVDVHGYRAAEWVSNPAQVDNEICTDFRDDHKVFAVLFDLVDNYIRQCTAAMGSPLVAIGSGDVFPASAYTANGGNFLYGPDDPTGEELAHLFVQSLMARNFQQSWNITRGGPGATRPKFGLIHVDTPDADAYYAAIERELAKYGFRFVDTATYDYNVQAGIAATQSAVLKFRTDGITHVFGASTFFMEDAESQKYYPRYAYTPGLGNLGVQNAPADQLDGALTVGWAPSIDVDGAHDPGDTPGAPHCRAVMRAAGLPMSNRSDLADMYTVCDALYSFRAALDAGRAPTVAGLRAGFESLGTSFPTALSFNARLDKSHHYGVDSVRDMAFNQGCHCLVYTSRRNR